MAKKTTKQSNTYLLLSGGNVLQHQSSWQQQWQDLSQPHPNTVFKGLKDAAQIFAWLPKPIEINSQGLEYLSKEGATLVRQHVSLRLWEESCLCIWSERPNKLDFFLPVTYWNGVIFYRPALHGWYGPLTCSSARPALLCAFSCFVPADVI